MRWCDERNLKEDAGQVSVAHTFGEDETEPMEGKVAPSAFDTSAINIGVKALQDSLLEDGCQGSEIWISKYRKCGRPGGGGGKVGIGAGAALDPFRMKIFQKLSSV